MTDINVQVKPGQRIVIHDEDGVAQAILTVDLHLNSIKAQFRSAHMVTYRAQEWVHPEDGEEL